MLSDRPAAFGKVLQQPGSVAWSPDSERLAVASGADLLLVDPKGRVVQSLPGINPVFIDWTPSRGLLVTARGADGSTRVLACHPRLEEHQPIPGTEGVAAAFGLWDARSVLALRADIRSTDIGTFADIRLTLFGKGVPQELGTTHANLPPDISLEAYLSGWTVAGLRPFYDTFLTPRFQKPPMFPPYIGLSALDPFTREVEPVGRLELKRYWVPVSWSPDGRVLAFPDQDGHLMSMEVGSGTAPRLVTQKFRGLYASWHPNRQVIFFGGFLVHPKGTPVSRIPGTREETLGVWSPDGRHLAMLDRNGLRIFPDVPIPPEAGPWKRSPPVLEARDKLRDLKLLMRDGLITREDYETRKQKHMEILAK